MEYIYTALMLHKLGKEVNEPNVKHVLEAAGIKPDENKIKALVVALKDVDIDKAIKEAAFAPVTFAQPTQAAQEKKVEKKEEEKKSEEQAAAGLSALFGWINFF